MILGVIDTDFSLHTISPLNLRLRLTVEPNGKHSTPTNRLPMLRDLVKNDAEVLIAFLAAVIFFCFFVSVLILYIGLFVVTLGLQHQYWQMQEETTRLSDVADHFQVRIERMEDELDEELHLRHGRVLSRRPII